MDFRGSFGNVGKNVRFKKWPEKYTWTFTILLSFRVKEVLIFGLHHQIAEWRQTNSEQSSLTKTGRCQLTAKKDSFLHKNCDRSVEIITNLSAITCRRLKFSHLLSWHIFKNTLGIEIGALRNKGEPENRHYRLVILLSKLLKKEKKEKNFLATC